MSRLVNCQSLKFSRENSTKIWISFGFPRQNSKIPPSPQLIWRFHQVLEKKCVTLTSTSFSKNAPFHPAKGVSSQQHPASEWVWWGEIMARNPRAKLFLYPFPQLSSPILTLHEENNVSLQKYRPKSFPAFLYSSSNIVKPRFLLCSFVQMLPPL